MRVTAFFGRAVVCVLACMAVACGTYSELTPAAQSVPASTIRPSGHCESLGTVTGKGGGAGGGYVSNESLIQRCDAVPAGAARLRCHRNPGGAHKESYVIKYRT